MLSSDNRRILFSMMKFNVFVNNSFRMMNQHGAGPNINMRWVYGFSGLVYPFYPCEE